MTTRERLQLSFLRRLLATREGRKHVLTMVADAEGSDESQIFDRTLSQVDDPKLARMIEKHRSDEQRHEELFRACADRIAVTLPPIPSNLRLLDRIADMTDHFLERPIEDGKGVMEAYLLLQVIEERAIAQFMLMERAFREIDPATADTFAEVARDEERHLKYCHAIARRYATDEAHHQETLERFRRIEAKAFAANSRANLDYAFEKGWFKANLLERLAFRLLASVQQLGTPPTAIEQRAWQTPIAVAA